MADQTTVSSFQIITTGDTNDNVLTIGKGVTKNPSYTVFVQVLTGSGVKFNSDGTAASGSTATTAMGWIPITVSSENNQFRFQGSGASDTFAVTV